MLLDNLRLLLSDSAQSLQYSWKKLFVVRIQGEDRHEWPYLTSSASADFADGLRNPRGIVAGFRIYAPEKAAKKILSSDALQLRDSISKAPARFLADAFIFIVDKHQKDSYQLAPTQVAIYLNIRI